MIVPIVEEPAVTAMDATNIHMSRLQNFVCIYIYTYLYCFGNYFYTTHGGLKNSAAKAPRIYHIKM